MRRKAVCLGRARGGLLMRSLCIFMWWCAAVPQDAVATSEQVAMVQKALKGQRTHLFW